ncbi:MAG: MATE family efflux transporter [Clostridiales bacterium]|nr:MATE family efflux transporter [Clostridiales bacterium]
MKSVVKTMTNGSPTRLILSFALPTLIGNIFQLFYSFADAAIVGKFVGAQALAAIGVSSNITNFLFALASGLTTGAAIIFSQCFGAQNYGKMRSALTSMIYAVSFVTFVVTAAGMFLSPIMLRLLGTPDAILSDAVLYTRIILGGAAASFTYNGCSALLRSLGNTVVPLIMLIISVFANILGDLLFIKVFHMGVGGAAAATVISQVISASICLHFVYRHKSALHLDGASFKPNKAMIRLVFVTGVPAAIQSTMISLGIMSVQRLINSFGTMTIAAYSAATKIDSIALMAVVSTASALSVYCSQNIGAGLYERIRPGLVHTLIPVLGFCILMAGVTSVFGKELICLFLDPSAAYEAVEIGAQYLKIIGIAYFMAGIMRCYQNVLQGAGDVNITMLTGIAELAMRIAASYTLVRFMGITGLWVAIPISWGFGSIIPLIRYYSGKWKSKSLV